MAARAAGVPPDAAFITSSRVMRPPSPLPFTAPRSTSCSRASLRTEGGAAGAADGSAAGSAFAAGAAATASPAGSMSQSAAPTPTTSPSLTRSFTTTPPSGAGISVSALSVSTVTSG